MNRQTSGTRAQFSPRFGFVKTTVINGELPAAVLSIDFDKAVAELNIAPRVILLRLNRRCEDRIDSND